MVLGLVAAVTALLVGLVLGGNVEVLNPAGSVAEKQRNLIYFASALSLIIVVPVFAITFYIVWKYRAGKKAKYSPKLDHHTGLEVLWWAIPLALISVLSVIAWRTSHELDPHKSINSSQKPLTVQVVALQWKWLFIYPEQNVASVNFLQVPVGREVEFVISSDAPMNSFWIPQLGSQIYAMSGMSTKLHLVADKPGIYRGASANISGAGFADMNFGLKADSDAAFDAWVKNIKDTSTTLDMGEYDTLAKPGTTEAKYYGQVENNLYNAVVEKYMAHGADMKMEGQ